jgi:hypothetical protein
MRGFTKPVVLFIACISIVLFTGCRSTAADASPANRASPDAGKATQQLILKLKSPSSSGFACRSDGIASLGAAVGAMLEFVRPMSGGACVVRLEAPGPSELTQAFSRLKRHSAVEWVEADSIMKAL